ncbi:hypothetical protein HETIRDRAFT_440850 [Heterobasidion irregulare TC 32-1]|uniref:Uncharacterized protein n=1 Tax=Heterobasidion irregulare (strain TC 32-1) TaxID=747525 RepID=W4K244_HETIT|nr:uncharacterized protein HETIRDRAFT_440850 [Heterobasidion irregulare TC 32-1]ETW79888.1 hypothetical protein HETIRDRAFT_440850 [Heterobasidion irregulare TC 32-1]
MIREKKRERWMYICICGLMGRQGMAGEIAYIPSRLGVLYRGYDNNNSNNNGSASRVESREDADEWVSGLGLQKMSRRAYDMQRRLLPKRI